MLTEQQIENYKLLSTIEGIENIEVFKNQEILAGDLNGESVVRNYLKDWNDLMKVLEIIEKQGCIVELWMSLGRGCRICRVGNKNEKAISFVHESMDPFESAFECAVQYVKWLQENGKLWTQK